MPNIKRGANVDQAFAPEGSVLSYTNTSLPDISTLGVGETVVVDKQLVEKLPNGTAIVGASPKRSSFSVNRLYGGVGKDTTAGRTAHLIMQAPAHFDAVRVNVLSAESAGNAWKITIHTN